jgi:hypothetical protein
MSKAVLDNILHQLQELEPEELDRVGAEVNALRAGPVTDARAAAEADLLRAGLISGPLKTAGGPRHDLVTATGEPLSETVIRERR